MRTAGPSRVVARTETCGGKRASHVSASHEAYFRVESVSDEQMFKRQPQQVGRIPTQEVLWDTIGAAVPRYERPSGRNYFRHCGYSAATAS